ncbi:NUDIX hydrolase [Ureibacillus manganicus]|uniref:DNA mismatch repair protein MutT n=1 Tax=Ureibacillus manganicus DSM 26584 TaxID=1384049 RepID=A0A0A3HXV0_9BACL|nr:NUDIX domain-containing protein [Ureibacillus manganicus]KGR77421.1 DNA mismatch repair protein MutT [Ureibacillus manganicus DSM 26584]
MYPRANTLGLIFKDNFILLEEQEGKHSKGIGYYYRPIGGTIELGEKSDETIIREFYEELGVEIVIKSYISCLENIFYIYENVGHEITQIYLVDFKDKDLYQNEYFIVSEKNKVTRAIWVAKEELLLGNKILYPNGLIDLLIEEF